VAEEPETVDAEAVEESKPLARDLELRDREDPSAIFRTLDRHDEAQILDELVGRQLKVMLYSYVKDGKRVTDLSYAGVKETVRTLNARGATRIKVVEDPAPVFEDVMDGEESFIQCTVYAVDTLNGGGGWGTAEEPRNMKLKNGKTKRDPFARQKALGKAQRNAEKTMIPEEFRQLLIALFLKDQQAVREIREGAATDSDLAQLPPPIDTPEMKVKEERARELYAEIQQHAPGGVKVGLTPGNFFRYTQRGLTDHGRMDEFLVFLEERLVAAKSGAES
jgi:hypothetical protein